MFVDSFKIEREKPNFLKQSKNYNNIIVSFLSKRINSFYLFFRWLKTTIFARFEEIFNIIVYHFSFLSITLQLDSPSFFFDFQTLFLF